MTQLTPSPAPVPQASVATDRRAGGAPREDPLRRAAEAFEAAFLAEMLRHTGLGRMPESFNGGAGEAAFSGTLVQEYAKQIAAQGGVGLADQIHRSLAARARK